MDFSHPVHGHYPDSMCYTYENNDSFEVGASQQPPPEAVGWKSARWSDFEHRIFISAADLAMAEGHQSEKCFSTKGWERIRSLFNREAGNKWTISQLKNHWNVMRLDNKLLFELLNCTGVEFGLNNGNRIHASEQWWATKKQLLRYYNLIHFDV